MCLTSGIHGKRGMLETVPTECRCDRPNRYCPESHEDQVLVRKHLPCPRPYRDPRWNHPRRIVEWKLEGHTNARIAELLDVSVHTVGRKLRMIRLTWVQELS